jgi:hypothetical protein
MIVIASGAYIAKEFQAEIGRIPPAFLPLGNKRLFEHQIQRLKKSFPSEKIYLSLPEDFEVARHDTKKLTELGVQIIRVSEDLSLGSSILHVINSIGTYDEPLRQLHGDTLIEEFPSGDDVLGLSQVIDDYAWELESTAHLKETATAWCGYFSFSNIKYIAQAIALNKGDYIKAVRHYRLPQPMQLHVLDAWMDLGHVNTYYRGRCAFTTERSFNQLIVRDGIVRKSSDNESKIRAEGLWFQKLPPSLKKYTPQIIQVGNAKGKNFYEIEYLPYLSLAELYVFGALQISQWWKIFHLAEELLGDFCAVGLQYQKTHISIRKEFERLITDKTLQRLSHYLAETDRTFEETHELNGLPLPSLRNILRECQAAIAQQPQIIGVTHGDFCFSNILYDARQDRLKLIDPRGMGAAGRPTIYGDARYDIAKFSHSVVGLYDHIVSGLFDLEMDGHYRFQLSINADTNTKRIAHEFISSDLQGYRIADSLPLVVLLFLSMLPLHADSPRRQNGLYANALRIYAMWREI